MKGNLLLLAAFLAFISHTNAQEIKQNAFIANNAVNILNSPNKIKRIDPNFSASSENSADPIPQTTPYVRPDAKTRRKRYLNSAFGLSALTSAGASAVINQITNNPEEWECTAKGFGKRFASSYAQGAISRTTTFVINEAFKLDNNFKKSGQMGFGKRLKHVLLGSFTTRTERGKRIPDFPEFIGTYTGSIIARETWFPKRYDYKDGLKSGTFSIFTRLGIHFVREFILK